jgi:D-alanyl-D-alanine carboxypeptidase (penicillin-binding protein 5/6)
MFEESARLMDCAYQEFSLETLLESYDVLKEVDVRNGRQETVKLFSREKFCFPLTEEEKLRVNIEVDVPKTLNAPIKKEDVVGQVKVYLDGKLLFSDNVLTREEVKKDNIFSFVKDVAKNWF